VRTEEFPPAIRSQENKKRILLAKKEKAKESRHTRETEDAKKIETQEELLTLTLPEPPAENATRRYLIS
jgi:hypothetical protein